MHFPEEVAHRLTEVEYALFYDVEPVHYIRQGKLHVCIFIIIITTTSMHTIFILPSR